MLSRSLGSRTPVDAFFISFFIAFESLPSKTSLVNVLLVFGPLVLVLLLVFGQQ